MVLRGRWTGITLLLMAIVVPCQVWSDCPVACKCKWVSGMMAAECVEANLTAIPSILDPSLQTLDLSGNRIRSLAKEAFKSVGLLKLLNIYMRNCGVQELDSETFRGLSLLNIVDLSHNSITTLHNGTFSENSELMIIMLNGNPITELDAGLFSNLPYLRYLEFENCSISKVSSDAFTNSPSIVSINLKSNRLAHISERVFQNLVSLRSVDLEGNPWNCDCELRTFKNWLNSSSLFSHALRCKEPPALASRRWASISPSEFSCTPSTNVTETVNQGEQKEDVTPKNQFPSDPEPEVSLQLNGKVFQNSIRISFDWWKGGSVKDGQH